jgi:hypothetical protein
MGEKRRSFTETPDMRQHAESQKRIAEKRDKSGLTDPMGNPEYTDEAELTDEEIEAELLGLSKKFKHASEE